MANALALFATQRGLETGLAMNDALQQQSMAYVQSANLQKQMDEIRDRSKMQLQNIYKQSEKVVSEQTASYIKGGVELSGSAMSVISDTLNDAAKAAYIRQRESDYDRMGIAVQKSGYDQMASNETLYLKMATATANGVMGYMTDKYKYNQANVKNRGTGWNAQGTHAYNATTVAAGLGEAYA